ncbi:Ion channel [Teladorsagia circumcincta]|uniref:Ion channel n=1 Tax=Teladorsagia circumcincta TaxID=45464 RepID=A0A2G9U0B8_TELCI|nr:Ion channel [Teladorsagia circumcincta]
MCLSNAQAFRLILFVKRIYQKYKFVVKELLPEIFNNTKLLLYIHDQKSQYLTTIMNERLAVYEKQLQLRPPMPSLPCTFTNSLVFVFSTITTIGYGYIYPVTRTGRILSIIISLIGIPFTLIVIKDLAYIIAKLMTYPCEVLGNQKATIQFSLRQETQFLQLVPEKCWAAFRFCTLRPVHEDELDKKLHGQPIVLLLLFIYLLIGLSIVSLFINLLHTKFSRAYWLPGRMYMPLRQNQLGTTNTIASFDSYEELGISSDCPLNHFATLGILQTDDKCPLLGITRREFAYMDANTQTEKTMVVKAHFLPYAVGVNPQYRWKFGDSAHNPFWSSLPLSDHHW